MGRGRGGYTEFQPVYKDSGGHKVTDKGAIFVAERYIENGYEAVFRRTHDENVGQRSCDLTIKTSADDRIIKHVEVKKILSDNPSQICKQIQKASSQLKTGGTIALYFEQKAMTPANIELARTALREAKRKGLPQHEVEVWFSDKKSITIN